ncbi:MAG: beta-ketoacyl-ACP synthase II [Bacteroidia bacterium]|nr:beta-ketoacyl-ACP synthase II [Bacteroidia bacterium]MCX7764733.1 beta-ketoacyl-ACP synthase II [Bacteroidia bacterium]MDW8057320.1 beta-ketoacyl-ACP synthase II [Bacteroidia bacterium]
MRRVVITGLGALTPIGLDVPSFWEGLLKGVSGADYITKFDASQFRTRFACELKGFDVTNYIDRREARKMDSFTHYAIVAADEAIRDAGLDTASIDKDAVGVIFSSGIGGLYTFMEEMRGYAPGAPPRFNPFFIPKMIIDIAAGHISIKYGYRGPNYATVSACASSANAIADGFLLIQAGMADVMIVGGSEAAINEAGIGGFNAMRALSERNDDPKTASRPFDKDRDGFVLGEGAGALVLEELGHALRRGARIYAEIVGAGLAADAHHITAPCAKGAALVMRRALASAQISPEEVDYINVHGTSTPLGDASETEAIKAVFGEHAYKLNISSTKSMIGHLLGAAGAVEAVATVLSVYHQTVHPTINHFTDDPECDLNYTFHHPVQREIQYALSNSFGFGGHNACIVFRRYV